MINILKPEENPVYGIFPETVEGDIPPIAIDFEWMREHVANYKTHGKSLEVCTADLSCIVANEEFQWASAEMKRQFITDIAKIYNS